MSKLTEKKIRNIVKKRLIETKCVSEDVKWLTDEIYDMFIEKFNNTAWEQLPPFKYLKDGTYIIEERHRIKHVVLSNCMTIKKIWFNIFDFPDEENYNETGHNYNFDSEYDSVYNTITINGVSINSKLKEGSVKSSLTHELRHIFKFSFSDYNFNKLYYSGLNFLKNSNSKGDINKNINYAVANLGYFFCNDEIYANSQAIYEYLMKLIEVYNKEGKKFEFNEKNLIYSVPIYNKYYNLKILYKNLLNGLYNESNYNEKWFQDIPLNKIKKYIEHQIKYCETKLGKAVQHAKDSERQLNEGFVRLHHKNDILFGNNTSFLI